MLWDVRYVPDFLVWSDIDDLAKVREVLDSPELRKTMREAGVVILVATRRVTVRSTQETQVLQAAFWGHNRALDLNKECRSNFGLR